MTAVEFADWKRLYRIEPWGAPAEDERVRILLSGFANSQGGKTSPRDFEFNWDAERPKPERTMLDFKTGAKLLAAAFKPKR